MDEIHMLNSSNCSNFPKNVIQISGGSVTFGPFVRREDDGFLRPVSRRLVHPQASDIRAASTTYLLPASTASHWRLISSPHCMLVGASAYGDFCPWFFFLTAFFWILTQWSSKKNLINYDSSCWTAIQGEHSQPKSLYICISPVYLYLCNLIWVQSFGPA